MNPTCLLLFAAAIPFALPVSPARAQTSNGDPVIYGLADQSTFEWGCFGPCACPILFHGGVKGRFVLTKVGSDPLFEHYAVTDVDWRVPDATTPTVITGSGTYRRGGEFALQEQLVLDLSFDGRAPQHFDSGLVPPRAPFPRIEVSISLHGSYCFDSVLTVIAAPQAVVAAEGEATALLTAAPSLFHSTTDVVFTLAREAAIDLRVFDPTGREARCLVRGERWGPGSHRLTWDGRLAAGAEAPAGLYLLRLATPEGMIARPVVKLR